MPPEVDSPRSATALLRGNGDFRALFTAQAISLVGDWFLRIALIGRVYDLTHSAPMVSALLVASSLPALLLSPLTGAIADRFERRRVLVVADLARAAAVGAALAATDRLAVLFATAVILSVFGGLFTAARQAVLPSLVSKAALPTANALTSSAWGAMGVVGAALGGVTAAVVGPQVAFAVDAASFGLSAAFLLRIHGATRPVASAETPPGIGAALRFIGRRRLVGSLIAAAISWGIVGGVYQVLLPLLAVRRFAGGDLGIGVLYAADGVGVLLGSWGVIRFLTAERRGRVVVFGVAYVVQAALLLAASFAPSLAVAAVLVFLMRTAGGVIIPLDATLLQEETPPALLGRIFAIHAATYGAVMQLAMVAAGGLVERFALRSVGAAAAGLGLSIGVAWLIGVAIAGPHRRK